MIGAPKAGTSALHAALARHQQVYASAVKEPKYYLCGDAPPPAYCGPGDAHSQQEWVWRRADYLSLFDPAPAETVRLESTPFYLYLPDARRRIAEDLPEARLVAIIRDPVDRAYSNWMHLWVDGLEPSADFCEAWRAEEARIDAGWAPFWHYRRMGRYGEQLADLFTRVDRDRVLVLRYRELVSEPARTLDRVSTFLGIETGQVGVVPPDNSRPFVEPGLKAAVLGRVVRAGLFSGRMRDRRSGGRRSSLSTVRCSTADPNGGRSWRRRSGPSWSRSAWTTSGFWKRSCRSPSTTGGRALGVGRSTSGLRAEAATRPGLDLDVGVHQVVVGRPPGVGILQHVHPADCLTFAALHQHRVQV